MKSNWNNQRRDSFNKDGLRTSKEFAAFFVVINHWKGAEIG